MPHVGVVMVRCPTRGRELSTGIEMVAATFEQLPEIRSQCGRIRRIARYVPLGEPKKIAHGKPTSHRSRRPALISIKDSLRLRMRKQFQIGLIAAVLA